MSPAKPSETLLLEEGEARTAVVIVPDRQLSLAIGKEGQNARLAAKLTGWRIDIKSESEANTEGSERDQAAANADDEGAQSRSQGELQLRRRTIC